jgi:hypothetical protein
MSKPLRFAVCLVAAPLALLSCGPDNTSQSADAGVPDAPQGPIVGGKLGAAIASAAAASSASAAAKQKQAGDQPPENGVFAPGEADKRQPKDAPPKIDVLSDGEGTKVQLASKIDPPEQKATVSVSMRAGPQRTPGIEFALSIKPEKSKDKPKDANKAPEGAAPPARMAATVTGATVPSMQGVSKELADTIGKLKGTVIRYDFTTSGVASNYAVEVAKGADELAPLLDALLDTLGQVTVVLPPKPVGVGAYWIVADRGKSATMGLVKGGLNVVRYRVFKVQKIENDVVTLSVDLRQYAADQNVSIDNGGQKADLGLEAFDSQGKGTVVWAPNGTLPVSGDVSSHVALGLAAPGAPPGRGPRIQVDMSSKVGNVAVPKSD